MKPGLGAEHSQRQANDGWAAAFVKSSTLINQLPEADRPEVAVIGRSNVGKSSLINALVQQAGLAKTSQTPGKTRTFNHYGIQGPGAWAWYLVDLPGYGFAKVSQADRAQFQRVLWQYLQQRPNLLTLLVLIDMRLEPQAIDRQFIDQLGKQGVPFTLVFTKSDKLSTAQQTRSRAAYEQHLRQTWSELPPLLTTSAQTGAGMPELRLHLADILPLYREDTD